VTQLPSPKKGQTVRAPNYQPMSIVAKRSPISATAEHLSSYESDPKCHTPRIKATSRGVALSVRRRRQDI